MHFQNISNLNPAAIVLSESENANNNTLSLLPLALRLGSNANDGGKGFCCCNSDQLESLITIGVTAIVTGFLWHSIIFAPIKLVAVFLHEFSHALATWLTCGKVKGIEVGPHICVGFFWL